MSSQEFASLLRAHRGRQQLSQAALADRCGVSLRAIRDLEAARVGRPRPSTTATLADGLGLSGRVRAQFLSASDPVEPEPLPQLPPYPRDFCGREQTLRTVLAALAGTSGTVTGCVLPGPPGVGKTSLALRAAHEAAARHPDGQLFVPVRGTMGARRTAADLLAVLLRRLDLPGAAIPADEDERGARLRSRLAGRRLLVVLDDVADEDQVRPVLRSLPGCAVLVTSRSRLVLEGLPLVDVGLLEPAEAVDLLGRVVGADRVRAQPAAAAAVVALCGHLPLAVRIAATRLAGRPHWTPARMATLLGDQRRRLDELDLTDRGVRAGFALSYQALPAADRRTFRLLGLPDAPSLTAAVAAALLDRPAGEAEESLERLARAHLVEAAVDGAGQVRYGLHDLLRLFARERVAAEEEPAAADAALDRVLRAWADAALAVDRPADEPPTPVPGPSLESAVLRVVTRTGASWFDAEWSALVGALAQAARTGRDRTTVALAAATAGYCELRLRWDEWEAAQRSALAAAERLGDRDALAMARNRLGRLRSTQNREPEALALQEQALADVLAVGDVPRTAVVLRDLGEALMGVGRSAEAAAAYRRALTMLAGLGYAGLEADLLRGLGHVTRYLAPAADARECYHRALVVLATVPRDHLRLHVVWHLAVLNAEEGLTGPALTGYRTVSREGRSVGDPFLAAIGDRGCGDVLAGVGRYEEAGPHHERALRTFEEVNNPMWVAGTLLSIGRAELARGRLTPAGTALGKALVAVRALAAPREEAIILAALGSLHEAAGRPAAAREALLASAALYDGVLEEPRTAATLRDRAG